MSLLTVATLLSSGCPMFTEAMADPSAWSDSEGEYLEIAWHSPLPLHDSLLIQVDDTPRPLLYTDSLQNSERLLLHRDSVPCPAFTGLRCDKLTWPAMANSKTVRYTLAVGICRDTADIPPSSAGVAWQRSGEAASAWAKSTIAHAPEKAGSPGFADPTYEAIATDCPLILQAATASAYGWTLQFQPAICPDQNYNLSIHNFSSNVSFDTLLIADGSAKQFFWNVPGAAFVRWYGDRPDGYPVNDTLDTLLLDPIHAPSSLRITEVMAAPTEPVPEWIEITNNSLRAFPLWQIGPCGKSPGPFSISDSLKPGTSLLATRDSSALRLALGTSAPLISQWSMDFLRNTADTVILCRGAQKLDSIFWPNELAPGDARSTPGWQPRAPAKASPKLRLSLRAIAHSAPAHALHFQWKNNQGCRWTLLDGNWQSMGSGSCAPDPDGFLWQPVNAWKRLRPGVAFLNVRDGEGHETMASFVVYP